MKGCAVFEYVRSYLAVSLLPEPYLGKHQQVIGVVNDGYGGVTYIGQVRSEAVITDRGKDCLLILTLTSTAQNIPIKHQNNPPCTHAGGCEGGEWMKVRMDDTASCELLSALRSLCAQSGYKHCKPRCLTIHRHTASTVAAMSSSTKLSATELVLMDYIVKNPHTGATSLNAAIATRGVDYTSLLTALHRSGWLLCQIFRYKASPRAQAYMDQHYAKLAAEKRADHVKVIREILNKRRLWRHDHRQMETPDVIDIFSLRKKLGQVRVKDVASILKELSEEKEPLVYQHDVSIDYSSNHPVEHAVWAVVDIPVTPTAEEVERAQLKETLREAVAKRRRWSRAYRELNEADVINIFQLANAELGGAHVKVVASLLDELSKEKNPLVYNHHRDDKGYAVWATVQSCDLHLVPCEDCGFCQETHLFSEAKESVPVGLERQVQDTAVSRSGMEM